MYIYWLLEISQLIFNATEWKSVISACKRTNAICKQKGYSPLTNQAALHETIIYASNAVCETILLIPITYIINTLGADSTTYSAYLTGIIALFCLILAVFITHGITWLAVSLYDLIAKDKAKTKLQRQKEAIQKRWPKQQ